MTENEYLQKQINLLHNALLNFKGMTVFHMLDSAEVRRDQLNIFGEQLVKVFNDLEAKYNAEKATD